jgi:hypothetical protein
MIMAGSQEGSLWHSQELYAKAGSAEGTVHGPTGPLTRNGEGMSVASDKPAPFFTLSF